MRQHTIIAVIIWVVATTLAVVGALIWNPFPTQGAEQADTVDQAFRVMTLFAAPVFGMVVAIIGYSLFRFRGSGPHESGAAFYGTGVIPRAWLVVTSVLCAVVIVFPGLTGLAELRADEPADLRINVTGARWLWSIEYPDSGIRVTGNQELVLPVDRRIEFNVTSVDVLHSFWIPAFRLKIDAVPGQTTKLSLNPTELGDRQTNAAYRLQCAEICGLQHANMVMPVRVLSQQDFDAWVQAQSAAAAGATPTAGRVEPMTLSEFAIKVAPSVPAGATNFEIANIGALPHEAVVIRTDLAADKLPQAGGAADLGKLAVVGRSAQIPGGGSGNLGIFLDPGKYVLICNIPGHYAAGMRTAVTVQ